jgi:hypothetical protein
MDTLHEDPNAFLENISLSPISMKTAHWGCYGSEDVAIPCNTRFEQKMTAQNGNAWRLSIYFQAKHLSSSFPHSFVLILRSEVKHIFGFKPIFCHPIHESTLVLPMLKFKREYEWGNIAFCIHRKVKTKWTKRQEHISDYLSKVTSSYVHFLSCLYMVTNKLNAINAIKKDWNTCYIKHFCM